MDEHRDPPLQKRTEERVRMRVPVRLEDGGQGTTRDICASGIFFDLDVAPELGAVIAFTVEFRHGGVGGLSLRCRGEVLRVEPLDGRFGVAARILDSRLEAGRASRPESPDMLLRAVGG